MRGLRTFVAFLIIVAAMVGVSVVVRRIFATEDILGESPTTGPRPTAFPSEELPAQAPPIIDPIGPSGFRHPGVLVSAEQLELARDQVRSGAEPWLEAFQAMSRSDYAQLSWTPRPRATVECGLYSEPNHGCDDEWRDAIAAYTHGLMWYFTGRVAYALKAVEILNAWAETLRGHTNHNAPIQAGWSSTNFARAAELLRHTYPGWTTEDSTRIDRMFRNVYLPVVSDGGAPDTSGNWDLIIISAAAGIAVYLDDRPLFDHAIKKWRARVPAFVYLTSDGPHPVPPPGRPADAAAMAEFWFDQREYVDGLTQETCRDLGHAAWGLEAMAHVAEIAWIQGVDLYAEAQQRLVAALELHAGFALADPVPDWLCGGHLNARFGPIPEIALNHYANRLGVVMPRTSELVASRRPQPASFFYGWATLTHSGTPSTRTG